MITPSFVLTATERVLPKLALDFTTASLDSRVTFTRALNTATRVNSSGYIENINANLPRFDYDPITLACKGLLIEESRTNSIVDSAFTSFSGTSANNVWLDVITELDSTPNYSTSPDNTKTAALLAINTSSSSRSVSYRTASTTAGTYTFSSYIKKNSTDDKVTLSIAGDTSATNRARCIFTLADNGTAGSVALAGTATSGSATISKFNNDWYRCTLTVTLSSPTNITCFIYPGDMAAQTTASQTLVWGAQLEAGAFPTSYIPTTTTALTRNADVATMTGTNFSDWYNQTEGSVLAEWSKFGSNRAGAICLTDNPASVTSVQLFLQARQDANQIRIWQSTTGGGLDTSAVLTSSTSQGKATFGYVDATSFSGAANGASVVSTNVAPQSLTANTLTIGFENSYISFLNGHFKKISYYPQRLTNAELRAFSK